MNAVGCIGDSFFNRPFPRCFISVVNFILAVNSFACPKSPRLAGQARGDLAGSVGGRGGRLLGR